MPGSQARRRVRPRVLLQKGCVRLVDAEVLHRGAAWWLDTQHVAPRTILTALVLGAVAALGAACGERSEPTGELVAPYPVTVQGAGETPTQLAAAPQRIVALDAGSAELAGTPTRRSSRRPARSTSDRK